MGYPTNERAGDKAVNYSNQSRVHVIPKPKCVDSSHFGATED